MQTVMAEALADSAIVTAPEAVAADESVAAHMQAYGPAAPADAAVIETSAPPARSSQQHSAPSQSASPVDVPDVQTLTQQLRETEAERDALKATKPAPAALTLPPAVSQGAESVAAAEPTKRKFMTYEAYAGTQPDASYEDYIDARTEFNYSQIRETERQQQTQQQATQQADWTWQQIAATHGKRVEAFKSANPGFDAALAKAPLIPLPSLLQTALMLSDDGPKFMLALAEQPDVLDEFLILTDGKAITEQGVAVVQRRLAAKTRTVSSGPVAVPAAVVPAPRPPNPVRTGPLRTGDEPLSDEASVRDHAKIFHPGRTRQ